MRTAKATMVTRAPPTPPPALRPLLPLRRPGTSLEQGKETKLATRPRRLPQDALRTVPSKSGGT